MSFLPSKRKQGSIRPHQLSPLTDDLTRDRIDEFFDCSNGLTDRQRLAWALQTEARVRLAKVEARDMLQVSHTLDSDYLFDIYPQVSLPEHKTWLNADSTVPAKD